MNDATTTTEGSAAPATRGRALNVTLWVLQALVAIQFAFAGILKVSGSPQMVDMFATIGAGQWFRYVIGALEIAGAIGLLILLLSGLAALGLVALMVGAIVTNLFILGVGPWIPIVVLLMSAVVAWGRWPQTEALAGKLTR